MHLSIYSNQQVVFAGEVTQATFPGSAGRFQVLPRHADLVATLTGGSLSYVPVQGKAVTLEVREGLVKVKGGVLETWVSLKKLEE